MLSSHWYEKAVPSEYSRISEMSDNSSPIIANRNETNSNGTVFYYS